ncbi:penicillin-binding protein [Lottiidibacillus patelloidae]|nr:penicillin-binding protein [Lottiidibacillus patelloidae]
MNEHKNHKISRRAGMMIGIFILLFFVLTSRIIYIQLKQEVQGYPLQEMAVEEWTKKHELFADRGIIYDRNGIEIAKNVPAYTIIAILKDGGAMEPIDDPYDVAAKLAPILDIETSELVNRLTSKSAYQVEFGPKGRNISFTKKQQIENLGLKGISFIQNMRRLYPNNVFASHVLGYTTLDQSDADGREKGVMGIEAYTNDYLLEKNGSISFRTDKKREFKLPDPKELIDPPNNGDHVYLTIDQKIQTFVEHALTKVEAEFNPEKIIAIVADAKTGKILAMSNRPSFDPNLRNITNWTNYAISARYEPGSTMKVFTLAAAIEEEMFFADELYQSGQYSVYGTVINDHNYGLGWGKISYLEGVQRSSNVAFSIIAEQMGPDILLEYYEKMGLTKKTGIDLPNEVNSTFLYDYPLEQISTAWGQGSAITPIQQVQATTAITNDGNMMKPYIIEKIIDSDTEEVLLENKPEIVSNPISAKTAKRVRDILETVITAPAGTAKSYYLEGYQVAGKTGTAQIPDPATGHYLTGWGNNIYSFLGFAPKDDPKLIVYVAVDRPKINSTQSGSLPVSTAVKMIMKSSLQYLEIDPTTNSENSPKQKGNHSITLKDYTSKHVNEASTELKALGLEVIRIGSGDRVVKQAPYAGNVLYDGEKVFLYVDGKAKIPNMTGWSKRDVLKLCAVMELKPNIIGSGFVIKQNIPADTKLKRGDYLVVELESKILKQEPEGESSEEVNETDETGTD